MRVEQALPTSLTLVIALSLAAAFIVFTLLRRAHLERRRAERFRGLTLKPNCLLTRYPILFLTKQNSLFRVRDEWGDVPKYLREHGYDVLMLSPVPGYALPSVVAALDSFAGPGSAIHLRKFHLFADESHRDLVDRLVDLETDRDPSRLQSVTLVSAESRKRQLSPEDLRPLRSGGVSINAIVQPSTRPQSNDWSWESMILDHAITLAERDAS